MATAPLGGRVIHGNPDDLLYVSESMRRCATCDTPKVLDMFNRFPGGTPDHPERVSLDCKACLAARREARQKERDDKGSDLLGTALAKATGRRALLDAAPKSADGIRLIIEYMGGQERTYRLVQRALKRGLKSEKEETAIKAVNSLLGFLTTAEKNAGPPIDVSELTEEDRITILMEPARHMLLNNAEMRKQLLNDPEVRKALLGDAGITVLEVEPNG